MARQAETSAWRSAQSPASASGPATMSARDFMARFGGSCRTKNLLVLPTRRREIARFAWQLLLGRVATVNRRPYALPTASGLPREFIRLHPWEAEYLFLIASRATRGIVEIGRLRGGSTFVLASANPHVPIWSIDLNPEHDGQLRQLLADHHVGANVELLVGNSQHGGFPQISAYDLLFIDGDHSHAGCTADLERYFPGLAGGGHVLLHDSYDGNPVQRATLDFLAHHEVETIRSPYNIASHWHTPYGSIAHLCKPEASEPPPHPAAVPHTRVQHAVVPQTRPAQTPPSRPAKRKRTRLVGAIGAAVFLLTIFGVVPELLGDWPYNAWGKNTHTAHARSALQ